MPPPGRDGAPGATSARGPPRVLLVGLGRALLDLVGLGLGLVGLGLGARLGGLAFGLALLGLGLALALEVGVVGQGAGRLLGLALRLFEDTHVSINSSQCRGLSRVRTRRPCAKTGAGNTPSGASSATRTRS